MRSEHNTESMLVHDTPSRSSSVCGAMLAGRRRRRPRGSAENEGKRKRKAAVGTRQAEPSSHVAHLVQARDVFRRHATPTAARAGDAVRTVLRDLLRCGHVGEAHRDKDDLHGWKR